MAETVDQLKAMNYDELIRRHDAAAGNTVVGTQHYLDEIRRREAAASEAKMIALTKRVVTLTDHVRGLTVLAVVVATIALFVAAASLVTSLQPR